MITDTHVGGSVASDVDLWKLIKGRLDTVDKRSRVCADEGMGLVVRRDIR